MRKRRGWKRLQEGAQWLTFSTYSPLIQQGVKGTISNDSAEQFFSDRDSATRLAHSFSAAAAVAEGHSVKNNSNPISKIFCRMFAQKYALTLFWAFVEVGMRFCTPLCFRSYLNWLQKEQLEAETRQGVLEYGWIWGGALVIILFVQSFVHHHFALVVTRVGFQMRQMLISALYSKSLRLNSSQLAYVTTGKIINLISNDVRPCDDACIFLIFLLIGPVELLVALVLISLELGFIAAIVGLSTLALLVPCQAWIAKQIGHLRYSSSKATDKRVHLMSQILSGSMVVKMLSWENHFMYRIKSLRDGEASFLSKMATVRGSNIALESFVGPIAGFITFLMVWAQGNSLDMAGVFYVLILLSIPQQTMAAMFVQAVEKITELRVAFKRLNKFLTMPERGTGNCGVRDSLEVGEIRVDESDFSWYINSMDIKTDGRPLRASASWIDMISLSKKKEKIPEMKIYRSVTLEALSFHVRPGQLIGVVGKVGSGKSSLLLALLGEMEGSCMSSGGCMKGNVSYVSQSPWIKAGTVKENVLFELDEDKERYDTIMEACALVPDLQQLPLGDRTELGERGINLSGGQKARLALARAAYADAEINLLDDPLSAVDPRVGRILFETCIGNKGVMKGKTRVLVTHQSQYLPQCDLIAVMRSGKIVAFAPWEQLNSNLFEEIASTDEAQSGIENAAFAKNNEGNLPATAENGGRSDTSKEIGTTLLKAQEGSAFVLSESKETGVVSWSVYGSFIKCVGFFRSILALLLCISTASFICLCNWWLSEWAKADISTQRSKRWVWINGSFVCGAVCLSLSFAMLTVTSVVRGSTKLHDQMTNRVMRAPLHFFHTNPTGRIVNRFSKDQGLVDDLLPSIALTVFASMSLVLASMVLLIMAVPFVVPLVALVVVLFVRLRSTYIKSSREVKRYEGMTRSPVYASVSETLKGLVTIRAFGVQRQFEESFLMHLDKNGAWWNAFIVTSRWLGLRLDMLSVSLVLGGVVLASVLKDQVSTQLLAFSLVRLFPVCWTLQWGVRQSAEMENLMTSVERMTEYTRIQQEHPRTCDGVVHPGPKWPANGSLTCKNLTVSYRQDLDPVLKNINFEIPGGSSVGVVGRTGSGKSSLILAIYRLLDATSGGIWLDGVDISKMGIDVLRSQLTIIPQDPVLFRGSVRMNLDPTGLFSDAEIWRVLAMSRLTQVVEKLGGLDEFLTDCGEMLSVGEKQLMCLARALLQDASIIILDEATANVDLVTDGIIQETLQHSRHLRKAGGRVPTMVTIAHRINTVMHSDLLIVLDNGNLVEFGPPSQLLKQNGYFTSMVEASKHMSIH